MLIATACGQQAPRLSIDAALKMEPLTIGAIEPSLAPQITVNGDRAVLSWIETQGRTAVLRYAERAAGAAAAWSEPRTAASGDDWFVNAADVPSVIRLSSGTLAAHWLRTTDESKEAYDLLVAFSTDDGRTWSAPAAPHHDGTKTEHGFASLFEAPGGGLGVVWLDGRAGDTTGLRAATFDRDGRQSNETLIDDRVCDCCPTAVALMADGPGVAYRDRSAEDVRDISIARLAAGTWTHPARIHADGWQISACPVNGPAVSARGRDVAIAWMTVQNDDAHAFAAFSRDGGATFGAPVRLDDIGTLGRVGVALLDDGSAVASWIEFANERADLKVRRVDPSGSRSGPHTVAGVGGERTRGYPRLVRRADELLVAWTETSDGGSRVRAGRIITR